mgnify:CR=1 FL=1|tara:strand:+ start:7460 stop:8890 length:1431 start_codon:yes stop_codon:yes gene_type:complete
MKEQTLVVKTNPLPQSRISIEIDIPSSSCKSIVEETIKSISRSAKLPGFRSGKIPKQVLIQRIGLKQLYASSLEKIIDKYWKEALQTKSIEPLCEPELEDDFESLLKRFDPDKNLKLILITDIAPTLKLKKTKGIKVEIQKNKFDPKSIDEALEKSRNQLANIVPVSNRPAQMNDIAVISFNGIYHDSKESIEGGSSESMDLELEKNKMIPGFVEGIIGMNIDETKKLNLTFPKDYAHEESRGKKAIFEVHLKDLKTKELPKLDDEFAKQSSNKNNLKELKKDIEVQLKDNFEKAQKNIRIEALIDGLCNELEVEIPKSMIDLEVRNNIEQTAQRFAQQGLDVKSMFTPELVKSLAESSRPQAEKNVLSRLALKALSEQENINVIDSEIDLKMSEFESEIKNSPNKIDVTQLREAIRSDLIKDKVVIWLEENSQVIEKAETNLKISSKKPKKTSNNKSQKSSTKAKKKTTKAKEKT